jgi:type II secretory ATPase GspE/PulE/Tfp pilus assembly ATPase PilB-like protein
MAPGDAEERSHAEEPAEFEYRMGESAFIGRLQRPDGRLTLDVVQRSNGSSNGVHAAVSVSAPPVPPVDSAAREAMEALLREQARHGASDLHLRSAEPVRYRIDGEIAVLPDAKPLDGAFLERMLRSIMSERSLREYDETNDADLAYELEGVARFRVNVFRDRRGVGSVIRAIPSRMVTAAEMGITPEVQRLCELSKGLVQRGTGTLLPHRFA